MKQKGIIEYPDHVESGYGDPRGVAFLIKSYDGEVRVDEEANELKAFQVVPSDMHPHQDDFLIEKHLISK